MSILFRILFFLTGNRLGQWALLWNARISLYLMGIGSGGNVAQSGERSAITRLRKVGVDRLCVFDVGANRGQFLGVVLDTIGDRPLTVHCFEPGRETFALLKAAVGDDQRVRINNFGLGRSSGEATLHYHTVGAGMASLSKRRLDYAGVDFGLEESVRISTIDEYCAENRIERIDLLKIDIEGHELDALNGAVGMFDRRAVRSVTFEFGGTNIDTRTYFQDFWYFFREREMDLFRITPSGYLSPIDRYRESYEQFKVSNFLAVARR